MHNVTFLFPGTFVDEQQTIAVESLDFPALVKRGAELIERYEAKPYAFQIGESKYYIGGIVLTRENIAARRRDDEKVMLGNMMNDGWEVVCQTANSYGHTGIFGPADVCLDHVGAIIERGDSPRLVACRLRVRAAIRVELGIDKPAKKKQKAKAAKKKAA